MFMGERIGQTERAKRNAVRELRRDKNDETWRLFRQQSPLSDLGDWGVAAILAVVGNEVSKSTGLPAGDLVPVATTAIAASFGLAALQIPGPGAALRALRRKRRGEKYLREIIDDSIQS